MYWGGLLYPEGPTGVVCAEATTTVVAARSAPNKRQFKVFRAFIASLLFPLI
jgi:hypothetical protein